MNRYMEIADELQRRVDAGEMTLEAAEKINDLAYAKYIGEAPEETGGEDEAPTLETVMNTIDEFLNEACCQKTAKGETVVGADSKSDTKVGNGDFARKENETTESNVTPDQGLGSKTYKGDITELIDLSDSGKETEFDKKMRDTKLRVYEAFEAGMIDSDEKNVMLEMLNLENYE